MRASSGSHSLPGGHSSTFFFEKNSISTFGHGTHFCIGQALAYSEAEIAFTTLLRRSSSVTMLDDAPAWRANLSFRGLSRLRLAWS